MAIALDAVSGATDTAFSPTKSWAHTVTGTNTILLVFGNPSYSNAGVITGVKWNTSETFTQMTGSPVSDANPDPLSGWYLVNPTVGTFNIVASMSPQSQFLALSAVSYTGVHQTVPFGTVVTGFHNAAGGASVTLQVTLTSASGDVCVFAVSHDFFDQSFAYQSTTTATAAGCTNRRQDTNPNASGTSIRTGIGDQPGAASVLGGYTMSKDVFSCIIGVPLKPAGGGGGSPWGAQLSDTLNRIVQV